jgi:hypothetical protein
MRAHRHHRSPEVVAGDRFALDEMTRVAVTLAARTLLDILASADAPPRRVRALRLGLAYAVVEDEHLTDTAACVQWLQEVHDRFADAADPNPSFSRAELRAARNILTELALAVGDRESPLPLNQIIHAWNLLPLGARDRRASLQETLEMVRNHLGDDRHLTRLPPG